MTENTWTASFIAAPRESGCEGPQPADYLRHEFDVADGLVSATMRFTAIGVVEMSLNGRVVGDEVLVPGWTQYHDRLRVSTFDVAGLLRPGRNSIAAMLGEGWAVGSMGFHRAEHVWHDRPMLLAEVELRYADRVETVGSDTSWRCGHGGVRESGIYDGERYDARLEPAGWALAGFDDGAWATAEPGEWPMHTLFTTDAPPVRRTEELAVVEMITTPAGRTVLDFGQNMSGWVRLTLDAPAGTTVTLHTCEVMIHGEPEFETNRTALSTDTFVHDGSGSITWEPRFTFHGFRYVDVEGWPGPIDPSAFTAVVIHTDMRRSGWFECSDPMLTQLHSNMVWSTRGNFVALPTDCPQRDERLGWTGDINAFAPAASFLYDVHGILCSWLEDLAADQRRLGAVPMFSPDLFGHRCPPTALWSDVAISLPWHLYEEYGDVSVLERQWPSMVDQMADVVSLLDERDLITRGFQFGDWCDPDSPPQNAGAGKAHPYVIAGAYLVRTTREMTLAAEVLGRADEAAQYRALHQRVRDAYRREWVTANGRLAQETVAGYALAISFGVFDDDQLGVAGDRLAALVAWGRCTITTGFAGTPWVMPALTKCGYVDLAYRMMLSTECPSVLYPITIGATTIWERWDAVQPDGSLNSTGMTSLNHYALGAVGDWLHTTVAGFRRTAVGYRSVAIAPRIGGGLSHASIVRDTVAGRFEVAWRLEGDDLVVRVVVPEGAEAEVTLPFHVAGEVHRVNGGVHDWRYPAALPAAIDEYDRETPMTVLRADRRVWPQVIDAVARHHLVPVGGAGPDDLMVKANLTYYVNPFVPQPEFEAAIDAAVHGHWAR